MLTTAYFWMTKQNVLKVRNDFHRRHSVLKVFNKNFETRAFMKNNDT